MLAPGSRSDRLRIQYHGQRRKEGRKDKLAQFDALSVYRKYMDAFDIDTVREAGRKEAAGQVAGSDPAALNDGSQYDLV